MGHMEGSMSVWDTAEALIARGVDTLSERLAWYHQLREIRELPEVYHHNINEHE
jgi:hypothetical protein